MRLPLLIVFVLLLLSPKGSLAHDYDIPPVSQRKYTKSHRLELSPNVGLSLNDPFYYLVSTELGLRYHLTDALALGVYGMRYLAVASVIDIAAGGQRPMVDYNAPLYAGYFETLWAPIYGKFNLFGESVLHFDTYVGAGVGVMAPKFGSVEVSGVASLGQRYFITQRVALKAELRAQMFALARNPAVTRDPTLHYLLSASLAVCVFLSGDASKALP